MCGCRCCRVLARALITGEEKQFVLDDLPAKYATKLISQQIVTLGAACCEKGMRGSIKQTTAVKLKRTAVKTVGATLGHQVYDTARVSKTITTAWFPPPYLLGGMGKQGFYMAKSKTKSVSCGLCRF